MHIFQSSIISKLSPTLIRIAIICSILTYSMQAFSSSNKTHLQEKDTIDSEVHRQTKELTKETQESLIQDAVVAIKETRKAIEELESGSEVKAMEAIERAAAKTSILLVRYPEKPLLPVDFRIEAIDTAPLELNQIKEIALSAHKAIDSKNYPLSRLLLNILRSEINIRTYNLPLTIYHEALREAASLLKQKKPKEGAVILKNAINTLVIVNQAFPIPLITAKTSIAESEKEQQGNPHGALELISKAEHELERAKALGYFGKDKEFETLKNSIDNLKKQLKKHNKSSLFNSIKEKISAFFKHQSKPYAEPTGS